MHVCELEMQQPELNQLQFMDVSGLKKILQELKQNRNKTLTVSFIAMIDYSINKIENFDGELQDHN